MEGKPSRFSKALARGEIRDEGAKLTPFENETSKKNEEISSPKMFLVGGERAVEEEIHKGCPEGSSKQSTYEFF